MKTVLAVWLMLGGSAAMAANSRLETTDCEFGEAYAFNRAECDITLSNSGDAPIRVADFRADNPGDSVRADFTVLAPHAKAYAKAIVNTGNDTGRSRHVFRFHSDEQGHEQRTVAARGFVLSVLDEGRPIVNFDVVDLAGEMPSRKVELTSHDVADFRVDKLLSAPSYVDVQLAADGRSATLKIRKNAPWGYQGDYVKFRTNAKVQDEVWVGVQADVHGAVVPATNPFALGVMRVGSRNEQLIRLTSKDGKDFAVGSLELEKLHGTAAVEACQPAAAGGKMVKLHISDEQPLGSMVGKLIVELPAFSQHLLIAVNGIFLGKDAKIQKLDMEDLTRSSQKDGKASVASPAVDINSAIQSAVQAAEDVAPEGKGPLLKWSVMNEAPIHGYQIFRAGDEKGPFVLLNAATIAVKKHDNSGSSYQWRDNSARTGDTYWYYIGIVYNDGHKQQLTGPQKVVAK